MHQRFTAAQATEQGVPGWTEHSEVFTPTEAEVAAFEAGLENSLRHALEDPQALAALDPWTAKTASRRAFAEEEIGRILERLPDYRRQVFGLVVRGQRKLFVNFLPGADWDDFGDSFSDWRERPISVSDGGYWFWAIFYDLEDAHYYQLDLHGYA